MRDRYKTTYGLVFSKSKELTTMATTNKTDWKIVYDRNRLPQAKKDTFTSVNTGEFHKHNVKEKHQITEKIYIMTIFLGS